MGKQKTNPRILIVAIVSLFMLASCSNDSDQLQGRWLLIKRVSPQGNVVDNNSPFNFMENYILDFKDDGKTLSLEYDSKGLGKRHGATHRNKSGEWKIEQSKEPANPYLLTLRIKSDGGVEETTNKVQSLSASELIYQAPDNFIWYFEKR